MKFYYILKTVNFSYVNRDFRCHINSATKNMLNRIKGNVMNEQDQYLTFRNTSNFVYEVETENLILINLRKWVILNLEMLICCSRILENESVIANGKRSKESDDILKFIFLIDKCLNQQKIEMYERISKLSY